MAVRISKDLIRKEFTETQLKLIQETLDLSIGDDLCLSKQIIFEAINNYESLGIEQYQFEKFLSDAIKSGKIIGYIIKRGRTGGVCKSTAQITVKKKADTFINFNGKSFKVTESKRQIVKILLGISKESNQGDGNILINNKMYSVPENISTLSVLESYLKNE